VKNLIISFVTLSLSSLAVAGTSMKVEGSCSGTLADGSEVSYTYYSNFNGCKKVSTSAVSFVNGFDGLYTGTRSFTDSSDNYSFNSYKLTFANSTGNTAGKLTYKDEFSGRTKTVKVKCEVRDYEYTDC